MTDQHPKVHDISKYHNRKGNKARRKRKERKERHCKTHHRTRNGTRQIAPATSMTPRSCCLDGKNDEKKSSIGTTWKRKVIGIVGRLRSLWKKNENTVTKNN